MNDYTPELSGVPETMLWTLHNRASEALRRDAVLHDEEAIRIYGAIQYEYRRVFGRPEPSHALRSRCFDQRIRAFLERYPEGIVVNLGEGLETQRFRIDNGRALWLSVDLPEAMAVRSRFIQPDERHRHLCMNVAELGWLDSVDVTRPVFVSAQGLLMYLEPAVVESLCVGMAARLPGAYFMFDAIPRWLSQKTLRGWNKTSHYRVPPMPWGIDRPEIVLLLQRWMPRLRELELVDYSIPRGARHLGLRTMLSLKWIRDRLPSIVHLRLPSPSSAAVLSATASS